MNSTRLLRQVRDILARRASEMQERGVLDRREFARVLAMGVVAPLAAACTAPSGELTQRLLSTAERTNTKLERWLFRNARRSDTVPRGARAAGNAFPAYWVSKTMPVWDAAERGAWGLAIDGAVRRPVVLSASALQRLATRTQRVHHYCVEGWSAVAQFHGVPLTELVRLVQPERRAGYVDFGSFDNGYHESWDLESAVHRQTLVVVGKDDQALSAAYGAPARVHSPVKLGYKNTKYLTRITFRDAPNGGYWSDRGYEWFGGT